MISAQAKQSLSDISPVRLGISSAIILGLGSLAAGAGVGGGGLFVPTYWLILGVGPKGAVPLSGATILGAAFGNFVSMGWQKHPRANRPLIDYEVATFTQPGELLGVVFGVLLNIMLPPICIIVFLAAILSYNARRTVRKGFKARAKETHAIARKKSALAQVEANNDDDVSPNEDKLKDLECGAEMIQARLDNDDHSQVRFKSLSMDEEDMKDEEVKTCGVEEDDMEPVVATSDDDSKHHKGIASLEVGRSATQEAAGIVPARAVDQDAENSPELKAVLSMDAVQFPLWAYGLLFPMTAYLFVYRYMTRHVFTPCARWDLTERDGDPRGWAGGVYWLWYWTPVPVFASFMYGCGEILKERTRRRAACRGYVALETDIQWDNHFLSKFPGYALGAGVAAGLLGIGGGMIQGPIFLDIGMEPKCATSATAFSILWTASSSTILWYLSGNIHWHLMVWVMCFGFVSGQIGQHGIDKVIKETGRPSYVIFLLGAIISSACVAMVVSGAATIILDIVKQEQIFFLNLREFKCGVPDQ